MRVRGFASTSSTWRNNIIVEAGAIDECIAARECADIALLLDHSWELPAGRILKLEKRPEGLWIEAELDPRLDRVAARIREINRTQKHGFSIGGRATSFNRRDDGAMIVQRIDLREITLTDYPQNTDCQLVFDRPPSKLWPADLQEVLDEQDRAVAAAAKRTFIPTIRYEDSPA